ncbi:MAG: type III pantothenate kinase [Dehalococcoidia bacterium]
MLLAIDIGNTNIAVGVFESERLRATWRLGTDVHKLADEYAALFFDLLTLKKLEFSGIGEAILSSSVPPLVTTFEELCRRYFDVSPMVVGSGIRTGVRIAIDNPREVGPDRVVNAAAAHRLYDGPLIVIDFGTATTFDAVSEEGDYLGGAIAPGVGIAAEALFERAAKLPRVELTRPEKAIGRNSVSAMQSGIIFGYVGLIEGLVARMRKELSSTAKVIATGGLAEVIAKETDVIDALEPDLTLLGLRFIHELNTGQ